MNETALVVGTIEDVRILEIEGGIEATETRTGGIETEMDPDLQDQEVKLHPQRRRKLNSNQRRRL